MLEVINDKSIHRDGIYDIDESCKINVNSFTQNDGIFFAALAFIILWR